MDEPTLTAMGSQRYMYTLQVRGKESPGTSLGLLWCNKIGQEQEYLKVCVQCKTSTCKHQWFDLVLYTTLRD